MAKRMHAGWAAAANANHNPRPSPYGGLPFPSKGGGKGKGGPPANLGEPLPVGLIPAGMAASAGPLVARAPPPKAKPVINLPGIPQEPVLDAVNHPVAQHKSNLCQFLGKSLHISLEKGDVQFETVKIGAGYKSTCHCPRLPRRHQGSWQGDLYTDKKSAEMSAAGKTLQALIAIPELLLASAQSKEERIQEKQTRIAMREQEKYAREIQHQVAQSQALMQQQQLAAYVAQLQQAQVVAAQAAQQQQQAQQAAQAALLAQLTQPVTGATSGLAGLAGLPSLSSLSALGQVSAPSTVQSSLSSSLGALAGLPGLPDLNTLLANIASR